MIKAVLFDVDGVLIDSFEGNRKFFSHVIERFGGKPLSAEEYKALYHLTAKSIFMHFFPEKGEDEINKIIKYGLSVWPKFYIYTRLSPNVKEALEIFKRQRLGIVTNKIDTRILEHFGIKKLFDAVISFSDVKNHKPHPEGINLALKKLGVKPEEALYVGDALSDLQAGNQAGVKVIIYRNPKVKGNFNITDFLDIPKIVEKLNRQVEQ